MPENNHTQPGPAPARLIRRIVLVLFLICAAAWLGSSLSALLRGHQRWVEVLFPLLALAATLLAMGRDLPPQNVLMAALVLALIASVADLINVKSGIPFGLRTYSDHLGAELFGLLPWAVPVIWALAIFNSRGVARLILRPWRKLSKYGFWVIGLTCALTVLLDFNLEPFASATNRWWIWRMPPAVPAWQTAPCVNFLGWAVTTLLILAFVTPWLINKNPRRSAPPDYQPLALWLVFNLLPAVSDAVHHLWLAAGCNVLISVVVAVFAVRGGRW